MATPFTLFLKCQKWYFCHKKRNGATDLKHGMHTQLDSIPLGVQAKIPGMVLLKKKHLDLVTMSKNSYVFGSSVARGMF